MTVLSVAAMGMVFEWNGNPIAEISNIGGPSIKIDSLDVTTHDSLDFFRAFTAGLVDAGEVTIEGNFYPGDALGQVLFITEALARTTRPVTITGPAAAAFDWAFTGFVTAIDFTGPDEGILGFTATIKITGEPLLGVTLTADLTDLTGIDSALGALTFTPAFLGTKNDYNIAVVTAITWIKVTPTLATAITTITQDSDSNSQTVASAAQSGTIALKAALSITIVTLRVRTPGNVAQVYRLHVYRA